MVVLNEHMRSYMRRAQAARKCVRHDKALSSNALNVIMLLAMLGGCTTMPSDDEHW